MRVRLTEPANECDTVFFFAHVSGDYLGRRFASGGMGTGVVNGNGNDGTGTLRESQNIVPDSEGGVWP